MCYIINFISFLVHFYLTEYMLQDPHLYNYFFYQNGKLDNSYLFNSSNSIFELDYVSIFYFVILVVVPLFLSFFIVISGVYLFFVQNSAYARKLPVTWLLLILLLLILSIFSIFIYLRSKQMDALSNQIDIFTHNQNKLSNLWLTKKNEEIEFLKNEEIKSYYKKLAIGFIIFITVIFFFVALNKTQSPPTLPPVDYSTDYISSMKCVHAARAEQIYDVISQVAAQSAVEENLIPALTALIAVEISRPNNFTPLLGSETDIPDLSQQPHVEQEIPSVLTILFENPAELTEAISNIIV